MIIAEQIAKYLDTQNIADYEATIASDIYIDTLPEKNKIFSIYNTGGAYSETNLGYSKVSIQIIYRGDTNPVSSFATVESCFKKLQGFAGVFTSGGNYIVSCISMQSAPAYIGTDKQGNFEYSMNFLVDYKT